MQVTIDRFPLPIWHNHSHVVAVRPTLVHEVDDELVVGAAVDRQRVARGQTNAALDVIDGKRCTQ